MNEPIMEVPPSRAMASVNRRRRTVMSPPGHSEDIKSVLSPAERPSSPEGTQDIIVNGEPDPTYLDKVKEELVRKLPDNYVPPEITVPEVMPTVVVKPILGEEIPHKKEEEEIPKREEPSKNEMPSKKEEPSKNEMPHKNEVSHKKEPEINVIQKTYQTLNQDTTPVSNGEAPPILFPDGTRTLFKPLEVEEITSIEPPNFNEMTYGQQMNQYHYYLTQFTRLKMKYPNYEIPSMEKALNDSVISNRISLYEAHNLYFVWFRMIYAKESVVTYQIYAKLIFVMIELFFTLILRWDSCKKFAEKHIKQLDSYNYLFYELGEMTFNPNGSIMPLFTRIVIVIGSGLLFHLLINKFAGGLGSIVENVVEKPISNVINDAMTNKRTPIQTNEKSNDLPLPAADNNGVLSQVIGIVGNLFPMAQTFLGNNNAQTQEKPRPAERQRPSVNVAR